jgi:hypothetical protein
MTESGKTTYAKKLVSAFKQQGIKSIVLDILCDPDFNADYQTNKQDEFLKTVWNSRSCIVVIDEGAEAVGQYNKAMFSLATRGRHWGHTCVFITQRATGIAPIVRDQCGAVVLFKAGVKNGEMLAEDFSCLELKDCTKLDKGQYLYKSRFGVLKTGNVFTERKVEQ